MKNNESIFDLTNLYSVYLLGFLWADGYLTKIKYHYEIVIEIVESDANNLDSIFMSVTPNWRIYYRQRNNYQPTKTFKLTSKTNHNFLTNFGYLTKDSTILEKLLESIPYHNIHYFYRGLFDGDGCVYFKPKPYYLRQISISSSIDENWNFLLKQYYNLGIKTPLLSISNTNKNKNSMVRLCNKRDIITFYNFIYSGEIFGLSRKYNKYTEVISSYK